MGRSVRDLIESIVFVGMKPGAPTPAPTPSPARAGPLRGRLERFLSAPGPSDPLYLTNRTIWQKVKFALMAGAPCLFLAWLMTLALNDHFVRPTPIPKLDPSPRELAAKTLTNLNQVKVEANRDLDVLEVRIDRSNGAALTGTVVNTTTREIESAEIVFDLTDDSGSRVAGVTGRLTHLFPQKRHDFRLPIELGNARFALVSEVRTR